MLPKSEKTCEKNMAKNEPMCGALCPEIINDERMKNVKQMLVILKSEIEAIHGSKLDILEPVAYRIQLVCGLFYFVKCHIGREQYLHIKIFEPLLCYGNKPNLIKIEPIIKSLQDPIDYF